MSSIHCTHCGHDENRVRYTISREDQIHRRRQCTGCDKYFSTVEVLTPPSVTPIWKSNEPTKQPADVILRGIAEVMGW